MKTRSQLATAVGPERGQDSASQASPACVEDRSSKGPVRYRRRWPGARDQVATPMGRAKGRYRGFPQLYLRLA